MAQKRKAPNMSEKLAGALLEVQRLRGDPIPRDHAKAMSAKQICSLYQFDHDAGFACHGVDNHPTMITPRLRPEHAEKTARRDMPAIGKVRRLSAAQEASRARILAKGTGEPVGKVKRKAVIANRGFSKTHTKTFSGKVAPR